jgi:hypothetical protein
VIDHPTAEFDALRRRMQERACGVLYPFEARPPRDWRMPVPAMPIGRFSLERREQWFAELHGSAVITPHLKLRWFPRAWSDGASIPWFLQTAFTPRFEGTTFAPAWNHDLNYWGRLVSQELADWIFYKQLLACKVHPAKARAYYVAVRAFGWRAWNRHTAESITEARRLVGIEVMEVAA